MRLFGAGSQIQLWRDRLPFPPQTVHVGDLQALAGTHNGGDNRPSYELVSDPPLTAVPVDPRL